MSAPVSPPEGWHVAADHAVARLRYWLRLIDGLTFHPARLDRDGHINRS